MHPSSVFGRHRALIRRLGVLALVLVAVGATAQNLGDAQRPSADPSVQPEPEDYLLLPKDELMKLPTSGAAWTYVVQVANEDWPQPDLNDQDSQASTLALAAGLVFARTGDQAMREKARGAIMAVIPTFTPDRLGPGLGPLRQTAGWVLAADLIDLEEADDAAFRGFLERVLSERTGTHSRWHEVVATHDDSANNWGAWAGAARIAAALYLGRDVGEAARTTRGFLGDRSAWTGFNGQKDLLADRAAAWACDPSPAAFVPVNGSCVKGGVDLDGAVPADVSRGSEDPASLPSRTGIMYTLETLAGYLLQAELLFANGYPDIYEVEEQALRRMADFISRTEAAGGPGWNPGRVQLHVPWLLNRRYGTSYPTVPAEYGRSLGFTDWLYGG